jgi:hypothetical protein
MHCIKGQPTSLLRLLPDSTVQVMLSLKEQLTSLGTTPLNMSAILQVHYLNRGVAQNANKSSLAVQ